MDWLVYLTGLLILAFFIFFVFHFFSTFHKPDQDGQPSGTGVAQHSNATKRSGIIMGPILLSFALPIIAVIIAIIAIASGGLSAELSLTSKTSIWCFVIANALSWFCGMVNREYNAGFLFWSFVITQIACVVFMVLLMFRIKWWAPISVYAISYVMYLIFSFGAPKGAISNIIAMVGAAAAPILCVIMFAAL